MEFEVSNTGCWLGKYKYEKHKLAYKLFFGPIPRGMWVLHKCDEPRCWNPLHLEAGTQSQNLKDAYARKRHKGVLGKRWKQMSAATIRGVRKMLAEGCYSQLEIAGAFGITRSQVSQIKTGYTGKRVK